MSEQTDDPTKELVKLFTKEQLIDAQHEAEIQSLGLNALNESMRSHVEITSSVGVTSVSTMIHTGKGLIPGMSFVVPTWAVHWGIIVNDTLYHLRYFNKKVGFHYGPVSQNIRDASKITEVGKTRYSMEQLIKIGVTSFEAC